MTLTPKTPPLTLPEPLRASDLSDSSKAIALQLTLPIPPSANRLWRRVRDRIYLSAHARAYRQTVQAVVLAWSANHPALRARLPLCHALSVSMTLYPKNRQRRDLDNFFKATLDALTHAGVWKDDAQIDALSIVRAPMTPAHPRLVVVVWGATEP